MFELSNFYAMKIGIASPEKIREWSSGEVTKAETINYRTQKPERDGLFCERIFGPSKDYKCWCGKYSRIRYKGVVCDKCGVEITKASVRRERMGHIELATPVSHIWMFKINPSKIAYMVDIKAKRLEEVLYYVNYIVLDPGKTEFKKKQVISDKEYRDALANYGSDGFRAGMGAEAIKELLKGINLKAESDKLKEALIKAKGQSKLNIVKRLKIVESFIKSGNKPEWMIMDVIPVLPPDLRPMVQLDGGRYATQDVNDLYRRVINRNIRLKKLMNIGAPSLIIKNEKRMLQEAVDALFDNGKRGKAVVGGSKGKELKSIAAALQGKQGRFRQHLLGKRVDYSGRAVIVVGPELKMYQCGVPKKMALELFKPFVMHKLIKMNQNYNIKSARRMVDRKKPIVWDILEEVIKDHPVLLNRAPTLHKLGIQAFEPILIEGNAIKLPPLVCAGFNADFDGDQMAIHVPLSLQARAEARFLMLASNNIIKPSDGKPIVTPQQDIVLGVYYLTMNKKGLKGEGRVFANEEEALLAYGEKQIDLQSSIYVRRTMEFDGEVLTERVKTTVGQVIFNSIIPQNLGFIDRTNKDERFKYEITTDEFEEGKLLNAVGKGTLSDIVAAIYKQEGTTNTVKILDEIKAMGYKYSTVGALTMSVFDMVIPEGREEVLREAEEEIAKTEAMYRRGLVTLSEKMDKNIQFWNKVTAKMGDMVYSGLDTYNPIKIMAVSKARANKSQLNQVCGMHGIKSTSSSEKVDIPIESNYRLGLSPVEYFLSARGGRKGLIDKSLKTADAGYLTRRLVDVAQDVVVTEDDCFANNGEKTQGNIVTAVTIDGTPVASLYERIVGRVSVEDIVNPKTKKLIVSSNEMIAEQAAKAIEASGITEVNIRTVSTCKSKTGVCAKCYGKDMSRDTLVDIGEAVGILSAQAIGEPGTQLTMNTFHTGGVASAADITAGLPRVEELFEARNPKGLATISKVSGKVKVNKLDKVSEVVVKNSDGETSYILPFGSVLLVKTGDKVIPGAQLSKGSIHPNDILTTRGVKATQDYIINQILGVYAAQSVDVNAKHVEVIVRQMLKKVKIEDSGESTMLPGAIVDLVRYDEENRRLLEEGKAPASAKRIILGMTKASLKTESFLSAASFQETSKVLTEAAVEGKIDYLKGLKENVIIGKLIPAGTGNDHYKSILPKEIKPEVDLNNILLNEDTDEIANA